jgi:hypothetical protein
MDSLSHIGFGESLMADDFYHATSVANTSYYGTKLKNETIWDEFDESLSLSPSTSPDDQYGTILHAPHLITSFPLREEV